MANVGAKTTSLGPFFDFITSKWGCGSIIVIFVLLYVASRRPHEDESPEVNAMVKIKMRIEQDVSSPSTLSFPMFDVSFSRVVGGYQVKSYFDAQNRFGATVRTHYVANDDSEGNVKSISYLP